MCNTRNIYVKGVRGEVLFKHSSMLLPDTISKLLGQISSYNTRLSVQQWCACVMLSLASAFHHATCICLKVASCYSLKRNDRAFNRQCWTGCVTVWSKYRQATHRRQQLQLRRQVIKVPMELLKNGLSLHQQVKCRSVFSDCK